MKLSEFRDEKALDVLADLLDPATEILADPEVKMMVQSGQPKLKIIKPIIKNHKKAVIEILAILDDVPVEDYHVTVFSLPLKLLEVLNDPHLMELFQSQGQTNDQPTSGSASENTEVENQ